MPSNLQGLEITDSSSVIYNFEPYKTEDGKPREITIETKDWEVGDPEAYWKEPLFPFDGGLNSDRMPHITSRTTNTNNYSSRSHYYSKANADASNVGLLTPPPAFDSLAFTNGAESTKEVIFDSKQFMLCGRYIITVDRSSTVTVDKDFGSGKAAVDFAVFNNELIVAMGESEKIWKRAVGGSWTQASDSTFAIALGTVGNKLWRAQSTNQINSCTTTPLTLTSWTPADPNEYTAGDTTYAVHTIMEYAGVPVVLSANGVFMPDSKSDFYNQAPQIANWPHSDNGKGAFTAQGYLWVPTIIGLLRITLGESIILGPEKSNRPDYRFWVRGGVEWGEHIFLLVTDELAVSETFICKMTKDTSGYMTDNQYIYHEWCRLGSTTKGYSIGINTWPSGRTSSLTKDSGTQADLAGVGTITWSNPTNGASSNNSYATAAAGVSHYLRFSNFGFALSATSTINGIIASIERKTSTSSANSASNPGSLITVGGIGSLGWTVDSGSGAVYAHTTGTTAVTKITNYLVFTNFGFAIPTDATILGITLALYSNRTFHSASGPILDNVVSLYIASTVAGNNKASVTDRSITSTTITYGSSSDTWGLTPTAAQINDSAFGFVYSASIKGDWDFYVGEYLGNACTMTVYYTTSGSVDNVVKLVDASAAIVGTNQATAVSWPTSDVAVEYGSSSSIWGSAITVTDVNDTDFGVVLSVTTPTTITSSVDYLSLTVIYTEAVISSAPSLFVGHGTGCKRINLGFGSGRDIDDPNYRFNTVMEIESGLVQPAEDVTLVSGLIGVSVVMKMRSTDSFTMQYAKEGDAGYTSMLNTQEGGGSAAITDATALYQQFTRYAAPNVTSTYFKFKLSGTLAAGAGTDRAEVRSMYAYGYIRPKVTDHITIPIYCDRWAENGNGIPVGSTGGDILRQLRYWQSQQEVLTFRFPDYETNRTVRVRVVGVKDMEGITEKDTQGNSREVTVAQVSFMRDDFANAFAGA